MKRFFYFTISLFFVSWIVLNLVFPIAAYFYYKDTFMKQTAECSQAMDEAWYIEQEGTIDLQKTAQVHLMACHEYDKTRKKMLVFRVPESVLSYLGLQAIELHQRSIEPLTEQHKFRDR